MRRVLGALMKILLLVIFVGFLASFIWTVVFGVDAQPPLMSSFILALLVAVAIILGLLMILAGIYTIIYIISGKERDDRERLRRNLRGPFPGDD